MTRFLKFVVLVSLPFALWGCGGFGGLIGANQFAGVYHNGTWTENSLNPVHTGTWNVVISDSGTISGACTFTVSGVTTPGTISGSVDDGGNVSATCTWSGQTSTTITGTLTFTTLTHVQGALFENPGSVHMTLNMDNL